MLQRSLLHPWEGTLTSFTTVGIKYNSIGVVHITCTAMIRQTLLFLKVLYKQFVSFGNKVK